MIITEKSRTEETIKQENFTKKNPVYFTYISAVFSRTLKSHQTSNIDRKKSSRGIVVKTTVNYHGTKTKNTTKYKNNARLTQTIQRLKVKVKIVLYIYGKITSYS